MEQQKIFQIIYDEAQILPSLVGSHYKDSSNGEFCGMTVHIAATEIVVSFQIIIYVVLNYSSKISHITILSLYGLIKDIHL